jgi:prefoldin subunit 5
MSYPQGAQGQARALGQSADRPMNRIESNLEDLNRAIETLDRAQMRIMQHAVALGYFHPEPPGPNTSPVEGRPSNLHEAVKRIEARVQMLDASLNVFD